MVLPDAKVEKVYLYPKPVDFRKSIDGLAVLVELAIKVGAFDLGVTKQPDWETIERAYRVGLLSLRAFAAYHLPS